MRQEVNGSKFPGQVSFRPGSLLPHSIVQIGEGAELFSDLRYTFLLNVGGPVTAFPAKGRVSRKQKQQFLGGKVVLAGSPIFSFLSFLSHHLSSLKQASAFACSPFSNLFSENSLGGTGSGFSGHTG